MREFIKERDTLLEVGGLTVDFPVKRGLIFQREIGIIRAVDNVDLVIHRGETVGLVGETGSGKSTTGRAILQLIRPTEGTVRFDGTDLTRLSEKELKPMRRRMQLIFQDPFSSLNPRFRTSDLVGEPLKVHGLADGDERRDRVDKLLLAVGLSPSFAKRFPHEFSGGQRQRIGIARALAVDPEFIVADEPISALDVSIQAQIMNLLVQLQDDLDLTYLFIAHDLAVIRHISDRVAVMYLGRIVELASSEELYRNPLHPYTRALLSAIPVPDPDIELGRKRIILTGDLPSAMTPPSGCTFRTRCWMAQSICAEQEPPLVELSSGHFAACHFAGEVHKDEQSFRT